MVYEAHIYEDTYFEHPQLPWELNSGDGHFATCPSFFTLIQATNCHVLAAYGLRRWRQREMSGFSWPALRRSRQMSSPNESNLSNLSNCAIVSE